MVMILTLIFGAHLLPFSWSYDSKAYLAISIIIPIVILVTGYDLDGEQVSIFPGIMPLFEVALSIWFAIENASSMPIIKDGHVDLHV